MKKNNFLYTYKLKVIMALLSIAIFNQCGVDLPTDINFWNFSGYVVDGYTGVPLSNVSIFYKNKEGKEDTVITLGDGSFLIEDLPFGDRTFRFVNDTSADTSVKYTQKIISSGSKSEATQTDGDLADISEVIHLFPLAGQIEGNLKLKVKGTGNIVSAQNSSIVITYTETELTNSTPSVFEAVSDKDGFFVFKNLPLAKGLQIKIADVLYNGIAYTAQIADPPTLSSSQKSILGNIYMTSVDTTNLKIERIKSNVLSSDGFGLNNVRVDVIPYYVLPDTFTTTSVNAVINGGGNPKATVRVSLDTVYVIPEKNLEHNSAISISITGLDKAGAYIEYKFNNKMEFNTETGKKVASNVLAIDGQGLNNVPVDISPYFVLPNPLAESTVRVEITGGGNPLTVVRVMGDTIFIDPTKNFEFNATVSITISGQDTSNHKIVYTFAGDQAFKTEANLFPVASNTWDALAKPITNFELFDTMWVKFSEELNPDLNKIIWTASGADHDIFGSGPQSNAKVWINKDTLFVKPDPRLTVAFGGTMGFKAKVLSTSGQQSDELDFMVKLVVSQYYIGWTNTKDQLGNTRDDFGVLEPIKILSSLPIDKVVGLSPRTSFTAPPDMVMDNISVSGDTIIYTPSLRLSTNQEYGMDFDVVFKNGFKQNDILGVNWKTQRGVQILSANNKLNGSFRKFNVWGDSLAVTFSDAIDTSSEAVIPFNANVTDVRNNSIRTSFKWNSSLTQVTVYFLDTLPTANYGASPAYTTNAVRTRAVNDISFDLTAKTGEATSELSLANNNLEIHTEAGLVVLNTNLLNNHDDKEAISSSDTPVNSFPVDGAVELHFSRALDTALIRSLGDSTIFQIENDLTNTRVKTSVSFANKGKTVIIKPDSALTADTEYEVKLIKVPGLGIYGAQAVNVHAGSYTGAGGSNRLFTNGFKTEDN